MNVSTKKKCLLLAADVLLLPGLFLCERLTDYMLSLSLACQWARLGGKCVSCGGTHFVNALLNGQFSEAFQHNQFLFLLAFLLAVSFVLLNLSWLFDLKFAKNVLSRVYTIPMLIVILSLMLVFFFARNIPVFIRIADLFLSPQ